MGRAEPSGDLAMMGGVYEVLAAQMAIFGSTIFGCSRLSVLVSGVLVPSAAWIDCVFNQDPIDSSWMQLAPAIGMLDFAAYAMLVDRLSLTR